MPKPFLKWVGGKTRLLPEIASRLPEDYVTRRHVEPFLGGGAVFFGLRVAGQAARLSDANQDLINAYKALRGDTYRLFYSLGAHRQLHSPEHYYAVRKAFNADDLVPGLVCGVSAARFVYLNKTCFNGLWRTNRAGEFNVPVGDYKAPVIYDRETLARCSVHLADGSVELYDQSYQHAFEAASPSDFFYLDPPYAKAKETDFVGYTKDGFGVQDQTTLRDWCSALPAGAKFMLSNADVPCIRALYKDFRIEEVQAPRSVGGSRAKAAELLIMNY